MPLGVESYGIILPKGVFMNRTYLHVYLVGQKIVSQFINEEVAISTITNLTDYSIFTVEERRQWAVEKLHKAKHGENFSSYCGYSTIVVLVNN